MGQHSTVVRLKGAHTTTLIAQHEATAIYKPLTWGLNGENATVTQNCTAQQVAQAYLCSSFLRVRVKDYTYRQCLSL